MGEPNVLLLDEPTNDLDLETMAILEDFIDDFRGAIVFVSHDRFFVDRLAKRVFVYQEDGSLRQYTGGYSYYKAREQEEAAAAAATVVELRPGAEPETKKETARPAAKTAQKRRFTFKEQKEYEEIDALLASAEGELKVVRLQMAECAADYGRLNELSREEARLAARLEELTERWAYLEEIAEEMES